MAVKQETIEQKAWGVGFRMGATTITVCEQGPNGSITTKIVGFTDPKLFEIMPHLKEEKVAREFEKGKFSGRYFMSTYHTPDTSVPLPPGINNKKIIYGS
ncbi:MAG: hypothetical protein V1858_05480 [Candidatus Gottesmanbacteria bacterium]